MIVLSLAIGIGANTAIFSVVNALLLKPLPYPDPDRLAVLWLRSPGINIPQDWPSPGQYIDVQLANHSFDEMSISQGRSGTLIRTDDAQRVEALLTSSSLFHLLGAKPLRGRLLQPDDDTVGKPPVVVLSYAFWKRVFNADPSVIGQTVVINGVGSNGDPNTHFEVVGISGTGLPAERRNHAYGGEHPAVWMYFCHFLSAPKRGRNGAGDENFNIMAHLKPGVTIAQAKTDVAAIARVHSRPG